MTDGPQSTHHRRGADGSWIPALSPAELTQAVHGNLRQVAVLAHLQRQGLVRHIGLSNVTPAQIAAGRRICEIVCVQNYYNLASEQLTLSREVLAVLDGIVVAH